MAAIVINIAGSYDDKAIGQAQRDLDKLKGGADDAAGGIAGAFGRTGDKLKDIGGKISAAGMAMTKSVTLPIVGVGIAAAVAFDKVDSGMDTVAARSGFTGDALKGLQDTFKTVAGNATQDFDEVAEVVGGIAGKLDLQGPALETFSTKVLDLARVTGTDAKTAADSLTTAMGALGVGVSDAGPLMDSLLSASQRSGLTIDTLTQQLTTAAPAFKTYGIGVEQSVGLLAAFGKTGIPSTRVVSGLSTAFKNLREDGVKDLPKGLADVFTRIQDAKDPAKATAIAVETFGSRVGVTMAEAIRSGKVSLEDLQKGLTGTKGSLDEAVKATDGPQEQFARLKNQAMLLGASFAELALPIVSALVPAIQSVISWFQQLDPSIKETIIKVAAVAAAIGPVLVIIGKLVTGVGAISSALGFLAANPIVLIIVAIAALVAGLIYAYNNFEGFRNFVNAVWEGIQTVVGAVVDWFMQYVWPILEEAFGYIKVALGALFEAYKIYWGFIFAIVQKVAAWFMEYVWPTLSKVFTFIGVGLGVLWEAYKTYWTFIWNILKAVIDWFVANVWPKIQAAFSAIGTGLGVLWDAYKQYWTFIWDLVKKVVAWFTDTMWPTLKTAFDNAKRGAEILWQGIQTAFNLIRDHVRTIIDTVLGILRGIGDVVSTVIAFFDSIRQGIVDKFNAAVDFVKGIPGKILSAIGNLASTLYSSGSDLIGGLIEGIKARAGEVLSTIASFITDKIPQWVKDRLGIGSPSKVMIEIGQWIPAGLAVGIGKAADAVRKATRKLAEATTEEARKAAKEALTKAQEDYKDVWKRVRQTTRDAARDALEGWKDFARGVLDYIDGIIDKVRDFGKLSGFDLSAIDQARKAATDAALALRDATLEQAEAERELERALALDDTDAVAKARERLAAASQKVADANRSLQAAQERVNATAPTARNIIQDMRQRLAAATEFGSVVARLSAMGLNNKSLQEIIGQGPGAGTTIGQALIAGGASAIADVNRLEQALYNVGAAIGDTGAQSEFGMTGANARGILATQVTVQNGAIVINFGAGTSAESRAGIRADIEQAVNAALAELGREITAS